MGKEKIDGKTMKYLREFKKKTGVEKIVVFGSYARGNPTKDSDMDLILVSKKYEKKDFPSRCKGLWLKWNLGVPVDFLPFTPKEFKKYSKETSIVTEALKHGISGLNEFGFD